MDFEVVTDPTFLGGIGQAVNGLVGMDKKREHGVRADFVNTAGDDLAKGDAVAEQVHLGGDINLVKSNALAIGERGRAELAAGSGDATLTVIGQRIILGLRKERDAGQQLRQQDAPVFQ
ncbi:MAG TPA: hypothetical protein VK815_18005 [Candidatus Acidoferrales bacterium]|nr:hypothetical protein [Candidatus Acidoferrales bacterium]